MTFTAVTTADGTLSCHDSETGEWCHNRAGAYTEALKNYAEPSLASKLANKTGRIQLLDACYGLGYNTWVLLDYLLKTVTRPFTLSVVAIEKNPDILDFLPQVLAHSTFDHLKNKIAPLEHNIYYRTLRCINDTKQSLKTAINFVDGSRLELDLFVEDLRYRVPLLEPGFDLVFHDAFSAQKMPELWTCDLFSEYHRLLKPNQGQLLTYSAAAAVRGGLLEAGFLIGKTLALGAKNGGTIAGFSSCGESLNETELAYLQTLAGIPYRDSQFSFSRKQILLQREQEQAASNRVSGNSIHTKFNFN